jgi:hypothetical protein
MLEHLVIVPEGGLCNRLRAIASAKRIAHACGARCTVVWRWGDPRALFADDGKTEWLVDWRPEDFPDYRIIRHSTHRQGGSNWTRRIPVTTERRIVVFSHYVFSAVGKLLIRERALRPWLPRGSAAVESAVVQFKRAHFDRTVGFHIRQTDNRGAIAATPMALYVAAARKCVADGYSIFLATDNQQSEQEFRRQVSGRVISYEKNPAMTQRWPRRVHLPEEVQADFVDLQLLAAGEFVVGSARSSYSRIAMLYNGSERCRMLARPIVVRLCERMFQLWRAR